MSSFSQMLLFTKMVGVSCSLGIVLAIVFLLEIRLDQLHVALSAADPATMTDLGVSYLLYCCMLYVALLKVSMIWICYVMTWSILICDNPMHLRHLHGFPAYGRRYRPRHMTPSPSDSVHSSHTDYSTDSMMMPYYINDAYESLESIRNRFLFDKDLRPWVNYPYNDSYESDESDNSGNSLDSGECFELDNINYSDESSQSDMSSDSPHPVDLSDFYEEEDYGHV